MDDEIILEEHEDQYPELTDLYRARRRGSDSIVEFMDWLRSQGYILCFRDEEFGDYVPSRADVADLYREFLGRF